MTITLIAVLALILGLAAALALSVAQLATILPTYQDSFNRLVDDFRSGLASLGVGQDQIRAALDQISFSSIASLLGGMLAGLASTFSNLLFLLFVVVFMALDAVGFSGRLSRARQQRAEVVGALDTFVHGTRSYLLVSTLFGLIVARIRCLYGSLRSDPSSVRSARPHVIATHQGARVRVAGRVH